MEKQTLGIGMLVVVFVAVIVGIALLNSAASSVQSSTNTVAVANLTFAAPANGSSSAITGYQEIIGSATVLNATDNITIGAGNYTIASTSSNGLKVLQYTTINPQFASKSVRISMTAEPTGYIEDSGSRAVAGLIIIFGALALAVVALYPVLKEKILDYF